MYSNSEGVNYPYLEQWVGEENALIGANGLLKISDIIQVIANKQAELAHKAFLAKGRGRLRTIEEIRKYQEDISALILVIGEQLENLQHAIKTGKTIGIKAIEKEIPIPTLLAALHDFIEDANYEQRFRYAYYTEALIEAITEFIGAESKPDLKAAMKYATRGTMRRDETHSLKSLAKQLILNEKKPKRILLTDLIRKILRDFNLTFKQFKLVAAKEFNDEMDEIVRQIARIPIAMEMTGLHGIKKLQKNDLLRITDPFDRKKWNSNQLEREPMKRHQEILMREIWSWYRDEGTAADGSPIKGFEVMGDATGAIMFSQAEFVTKEDIKNLKMGSRSTLYVIQRKGLKLLEILTEHGVRKSDYKKSSWTVNEILGPFRTTKISSWIGKRELYHVFRQVFADKIGDLSKNRKNPAAKTHPNAKRFADFENSVNWVRARNKQGELHSWPKLYDSEVYERVIQACLASRKRSRGKTNRGYVNRTAETQQLLRDLIFDKIKIKALMRDLRSGVTRIAKDLRYTKLDDGITEITNFFKGMMKETEEKGSFSDPEQLEDIAIFIHDWWERLTGKGLREEDFLQFLLEATFQKGAVKAVGETAELLINVVQDANGPQNEWKEFDKIAVTNLREATNDKGALDHIRIYQSKKTKETLVVPMQDKFMHPGLKDLWIFTQNSVEYRKDLHTLVLASQGFLNEMKKIIRKTGEILTRNHFFAKMEEGDVESFLQILKTTRDLETPTRIIACMRVGGLRKGTSTSDLEFVTTFIAWEPPKNFPYRAVRNFLSRTSSVPHVEFAEELLDTLHLLDESIIEINSKTRKKMQILESWALWGQMEEFLSAEHAMELYYILKHHSNNLVAKAGLKKSPLTRHTLGTIGYHKLGEILEQLKILKCKANVLPISQLPSCSATTKKQQLAR